MYLSLHLGSMLLPKFLKCWRLTCIKKFNFHSILVEPGNENAAKLSIYAETQN